MVCGVTATTGGGLVLRDYQLEAVDAALGAHEAGTQRPAEVLPTGAGKTLVIAGIVERHIAAHGGRALVVAHRTELIEQNARTIRRVAPGLRVGIVKAERDQTGADVISASVQTLGGRYGYDRLRRLRNVGLVVIDEAHHAAADTYMKVLSHFGCLDEGGARALGLTATMVRGDAKALGDVWQDIVYSKSIAWMISHSWLVRPRGLRVRVPDLDLKRVRKSRGDFSDASLGEAIEGSMAPELVAKAYAEHAPGRQGILFAPLVSTAEAYRDALREVGITAELVHGAMGDDERRRVLRRFEDGLVQVLCNCMVLTEGTDLPMAEVCVIGRPTLNRGLLIQMAGRVLRLHPGKDSALIIDVSGATERHSLLGAIELFGEESVEVPVEGEAPSEEPPEGLADLDLESPTDLDEELDEGPTWLTGPTEVVEVDLFHGSKSMWQQTRGGIWFLHAVSERSDRYVIVQRAVRLGAWDVIEMDARVRGRSSWVATDVDSLSYAQAFADANVTPAEQYTARKDGRWRARPASEDQKAKAERMGVPRAYTQYMTRGELSNKIDIVNASARIDPYVPAYARRGA
jgi:superfamily II DNA or RNA helicase